jgi:hypothetical protein
MPAPFRSLHWVEVPSTLAARDVALSWASGIAAVGEVKEVGPRPALGEKEVLRFVRERFEDDLHAKRVLSLARVRDSADTDEDCDGASDHTDASVDASTWSTFYADDDGDTYGDAARTVTQCGVPSGYVTKADDCDDATAARNVSTRR